MTAARSVLSIEELEAGFPSDCLARRTRCWDDLQRLHTSLPREYRSPADLLARYQRSHKA